MSSPFVVAVVGTGTDVGKTHVSVSLVLALRAMGLVVDAWKPVASGVTEGVGDDAARLGAAVGAPPRAPAYVFLPPISPHLAARRAGVRLDPATLAASARAGGDVLVVETAGGLYSPLGDHETNVELVRALSPDVTLLVASDRLGVLHDVLATLRAAEADGVLVSAVALSAAETPDASSGSNAEELRARVGARVFELPRAEAGAPTSVAAAGALARALWTMRP